VHRGKQKGSFQEVKVGEVVIVGSDNTNKRVWPLAQVLELIPGTDGSHTTCEAENGYKGIPQACTEVVSSGSRT
jgi:hypothetical protein